MPSCAVLNLLRSLVGAVRSFFKTQKSLAFGNLALRHQVGVLKRTVGNRRLRLGAADGLCSTADFGGCVRTLAGAAVTFVRWGAAAYGPELAAAPTQPNNPLQACILLRDASVLIP